MPTGAQGTTTPPNWVLSLLQARPSKHQLLRCLAQGGSKPAARRACPDLAPTLRATAGRAHPPPPPLGPSGTFCVCCGCCSRGPGPCTRGWGTSARSRAWPRLKGNREGVGCECSRPEACSFLGQTHGSSGRWSSARCPHHRAPHGLCLLELKPTLPDNLQLLWDWLLPTSSSQVLPAAQKSGRASCGLRSTEAAPAGGVSPLRVPVPSFWGPWPKLTSQGGRLGTLCVPSPIGLEFGLRDGANPRDRVPSDHHPNAGALQSYSLSGGILSLWGHPDRLRW